MDECRLQSPRNRKDQYEVVEESSWELSEERKNVVERGAHVNRDYIPLGEIWLEIAGVQIAGL